MRAATTILLTCVLSLLALGLVMLFSASTGQAEAKYLTLQPMWCMLGLMACLLAASGDYRWLKRFSVAFLLFAVVLLGLVFVPEIGVRRNGASRWLSLAGLNLQPSEVAKLALLVALAHYGEFQQRQMGSFLRGVFLPMGIMAPVLGLIFVEPDVGSTVLLAVVSAIILFLAGARCRYLAAPLVVGTVGLVVFLLNNPLRLKRILAFLEPEKYKEESGYQAYQAMLAIGSGGTTGVGLGDGRQKLGFVPEHHTDFIFSIIGEELGLVATLLVVLAFVAIVICGVSIAWNARDRFGMLLGAGVTCLIGLQAAINMGVVTGSLPNKGLPLPFISYGGSNLVIMLAGVGLLLNIARNAGHPLGLTGGYAEAGGRLALPYRS